MRWIKETKSIMAMIIVSTTTVMAQTSQSRLLSHESQIEDIVKDMTIEEKIEMLHGKNMFSVLPSTSSASPPADGLMNT